MSRALATIATIGEIHPHPDADLLDIATVRGWRAVVRKGAFHPTQTVLYIEPDAFLLDHEPRFAFLVDKSKRTAPDGKQGHVLRTVRLRGVVSQGLVMDLADWPELHGYKVGDDVTSLLPIRLWEPPVPLGAKLAGKFPGHLPKTDEERIQNVEQHRLDALAHAELIVVTEKVDGCLQAGTKILMADGTRTEIRHVEEGDHVLGMNSDGELVPSRVLRTWNNGPAESWLSVKVRRSGGGRGSPIATVKATPNHLFWVPSLSAYVQADRLVPGQQLLSVRYGAALTPWQRSVLLGKVLGDGCIHQHDGGAWSISWGHAVKDSGYCDWTASALSGLLIGERERTSGYGTQMHDQQTTRTFKIRDAFSGYARPGGGKRVPASVVQDLDPVALAVWYMDDGSLSHDGGQEDRAMLHANRYSDGEVELLIEALRKFGIEAVRQVHRRKGRDFTSLRLNAESAEKLFILVAPYIPPAMQRKLPERYRGGPGWAPGAPPAGHQAEQVLVTVESVEPWEPSGYQDNGKYDLTTETSNFFANRVLVHNSSITVWMKGDGTLGIAGRNWELASDCNTYRAVADTQAARWIAESDGTWAVQGELVGPGIQGNPLKLQGQRLMLFNVLRHGRNLSRHDWPFDLTLESVPIRRTFVKGYVFGVPITDRDWWLEYADGLASTVEGTGEQVLSEGVVIRSYGRDGQTDSFKAISATYLLKGDR